MTILGMQATAILQLLVKLLPAVRPGDPKTYISYGKAHALLSFKGIPHDLEYQGLGELAIFARKQGLPAITGLVIRQDTLGPGKGYFEVYGKDELDFAWWEEQIVLSKRFDWTTYFADNSLPPPSTPVANDLSEATRVETKIFRILRDTQLARLIKQKHNFCCQLCGDTILLANQERYAEAHHIRPLGSPHHGPDVEGNIICVCPNHHVELDYFARPLNFEEIRTVTGHSLDPTFLEYHNTLHKLLIK